MNDETRKEIVAALNDLRATNYKLLHAACVNTDCRDCPLYGHIDGEAFCLPGRLHFMLNALDVPFVAR